MQIPNIHLIAVRASSTSGMRYDSAIISTAGASAPEILVSGVIDAFRERYDVSIETVVTATENISFKIPRALRAA